MGFFDLDRALAEQGKALGPHPAFQDQTRSVATYQVGARSREKTKLTQHEAGRHIQSYGGNQAIDHVYTAVNIYADACAGADFKLSDPEDDTALYVRKKTKGTPPEYKEGPQDLYKLLDEPNPYMLYDEMMALLIIDYLLVGNAYWMKWRPVNGKPLSLYRLAPQFVKIIPGDFGPEGYQYLPPGARDPINFKAEDVVHFRAANPHSAMIGLGKIQGAGRMMDLELAITDTVVAYYENRADPSMIIQSDKRVPRDVFNKLFAQLRARVSGPDQAGAMLLLENGLKAETLDRTASESLFAEIATLSRDDVFALFRLAPLLAGHMDEAASSIKISDIRRDWENSTLRPLLNRISGQITKDITSAWDIKFRIDHRSILSITDGVALAGLVAGSPGIKIREYRRVLNFLDIDIPESTGDEKVDEMLVNEQQPAADANGQVVDPATGKKVPSSVAGTANRPLPGKAGRPPKGKNLDKPATTVQTKASEGKSLEEALATLEAKAMMGGLASSTPAPDNRLPAEKRPTDTFSRARQADITGAAALIEASLQAATTQLEKELLDTVEGKALKTSDIVSRIRNSEAWKTFRSNVADALRDGVVRAAASGVIHSNLTPDEEVSYDAIADEIINRKGGLNSIVKTLKDRVVAQVKDARQGDAERHDYNAVIHSTITNWNENQAGMIAETEAVHGYNEATLTVAELSGITQVFVTDGEDDDQPCIDADGSVWDIEQARENRLEHPRCRRAFLPMTEVS